jgi:hypothetical protein
LGNVTGFIGRCLIIGLALAWFVTCQGCAEALLYSSWGKPAPILYADQTEGDSSGIIIDSHNDSDFLYLNISTHSEEIKSQILGAFLQSFTVWFDPSGHSRPGNGVRVSFHRMPGVGFPHTDAEQKEYMRAATREVALVQGGPKGHERILDDRSKEIVLDMEMENGRLYITMKLPLHKDDSKGWDTGCEPGDHVGLMLECSAIDPSIAQVELVREYEEQYLGWGFGAGANPYGPKEGTWPPKGTGLGNYDAAGLDKSIYATHGVYRPLSWASVPMRLDVRSKLRLADPPQN